MKRIEYTRYFALMLVLTLIFCLCGCETYDNFRKAFIDPPAEEKLVIKVGIFEPLTGRQSFDAEAELLGMKIAHNMFPSVNGYEIELVYKDNRSSTDEAQEAAKALIDANCVGILGSYSASLSLAVSDIIKQSSIPAISATNTVPILTSTNEHYFRVCYTNDYDAQGAARYILEALLDENGEPHNITRAVVLVPGNSDIALGKGELFRTEMLTRLGISEEDEPQTTEVEYDEDGNEIEVSAQKNVEIYYLPDTEAMRIQTFANIESNFGKNVPIYFPSNLETAIEVISQAAFSGFDFTWIGTEDWEGIEDSNVVLEEYSTEDILRGLANTTTDPGEDPSEIETPKVKRLLDNVVYTSDFDPNEKQSDIAYRFQQLYKQEVGKDELPSESAALGFDAYMLIYRALESLENIESMYDADGKVDAQQLIDALYRTNEIDGATGKISINEDGDPIKDIYIRGFVDGQITTIYKAKPNVED